MLLWKRFDKHKPKTDGWYLCTVEYNFDEYTKTRYTMPLYWSTHHQSFYNNLRINVFDTYTVYGYNTETGNRDKRIYSDKFCDRTQDVIAWKNVPKPYKRRNVKNM